MNISRIFRTVHHTINSIAPRILSSEPITNVINRKMHFVCNKQYLGALPSICTNKISLPSLLQPIIPIYNSVCGMKVKTSLHRRCRHCRFVWKQERLYVMCNKHPRHKVAQRKKKEYNTWILTHASQSPKRPW